MESVLVALQLENFSQLWTATEEHGHFAFLLLGDRLEHLVPIGTASVRAGLQTRDQVAFRLKRHDNHKWYWAPLVVFIKGNKKSFSNTRVRKPFSTLLKALGRIIIELLQMKDFYPSLKKSPTDGGKEGALTMHKAHILFLTCPHLPRHL